MKKDMWDRELFTSTEIMGKADTLNIEVHEEYRSGKKKSFTVFMTDEDNQLFAKESGSAEDYYFLCNQFEGK